jgi:DNA polymerase III gamma/tau subunit
VSQLIIKHRPAKFEQVAGQDAAIKALSGIIAKRTSQTFLFSGPSGCGKTTLARITASMVGAQKQDLLEVDAATFSGIDKVREIQQHMTYRPVGGSVARAALIDECHRLSAQAWDAFLKTIEEPQKNVYWLFLTTNPSKVPKTIKTRCSPITLKEVTNDDLRSVVERVIKREKLDTPEAVIDIVIREAGGSPRQAILNLSMVAECTTGKEAKKVLHSAAETDATRELCNLLMKGGSWAKAMAIVEQLAGENYEGVRIVVCNFLGAVLKNAKSDDRAIEILMTLENWSQPYNQAEGVAPLLKSIGRSLFSGD